MPADHPPICDYEGSDYQTSFWELGDRAYEDRVEAIALARLLPPGGEMLLEIGAGAGRNTPRYRDFDRIVLLDYSSTQLRQAQERLGRSDRYTFVAADAYRLPFIPGRFEAATLIRTLHHLADPQRAIAQVRQVLGLGGTFILEYANKHNLKAILRFFLGRQSWNPFTTEPVEFAALNYDFHPTAVKSWLQTSGFHLERQLTVSHFRSRSLKRWVPVGALVRFDSLAQLTGDWWQLSPSVFVKARAVGESRASPTEGLFLCPVCAFSPLPEGTTMVVCPSCSTRFPVDEGIYDFRVK